MDKIYIVMDYVEHDMKSLMEHIMKTPFTIGEMKILFEFLFHDLKMYSKFFRPSENAIITIAARSATFAR